MRYRIDINCDMGEDENSGSRDEALMGLISSANIACGGHAGSSESMARTLEAANRYGVCAGAHPSYPDRENFGRVRLRLSPDEIHASVSDQLVALRDIARTIGTVLTHVKPHGALYHAAMNSHDVAEAIFCAVEESLGNVTLVGLAGASGVAWWRQMGASVIEEAFADRRYEADGSLRARSLPDAMIESPIRAAEQSLRIANGLGAVSLSGEIVPIRADTICIHSDSACALENARAVCAALAC